MKWNDKPKAEQRADMNRYKASKKALDNYGRKASRSGEHGETATYRQLNQAVIDAEQEIPWWKR